MSQLVFASMVKVRTLLGPSARTLKVPSHTVPWVTLINVSSVRDGLLELYGIGNGAKHPIRGCIDGPNGSPAHHTAAILASGLLGHILWQVLLNETRTQMDINLDEGRVSDATKAMDLPGLDHENIAGDCFEFLALDVIKAPPLPDELDFIVRMTMGTGTFPRKGAEKKGGYVDIAVLGANKVM